MCLDCGCRQASNDHGDKRHLLLGDLQGAAFASGIPIEEAARNILDTVTNIPAEEVFLAAFASQGKRKGKRKRSG